MHMRIKRMVLTALMGAMVCVATMVIKIPSPLGGYLNIGDGIVLLCGWLPGGIYGILAAGLGSALADLLGGYMLYAPATLVIKGGMALVTFLVFKLLHTRAGRLPAQIIGGVLAEALMILGYYVFEGFLYGFLPAAVNIPANGVQGGVGVILGIMLIKVSERLRLTT